MAKARPVCSLILLLATTVAARQQAASLGLIDDLTNQINQVRAENAKEEDAAKANVNSAKQDAEALATDNKEIDEANRAAANLTAEQEKTEEQEHKDMDEAAELTKKAQKEVGYKKYWKLRLSGIGNDFPPQQSTLTTAPNRPLIPHTPHAYHPSSHAPPRTQRTHTPAHTRSCPHTQANKAAGLWKRFLNKRKQITNLQGKAKSFAKALAGHKKSAKAAGVKFGASKVRLKGLLERAQAEAMRAVEALNAMKEEAEDSEATSVAEGSVPPTTDAEVDAEVAGEAEGAAGAGAGASHSTDPNIGATTTTAADGTSVSTDPNTGATTTTATDGTSASTDPNTGATTTTATDGTSVSTDPNTGSTTPTVTDDGTTITATAATTAPDGAGDTGLDDDLQIEPAL